uniref:Sua5 family C-terminal domain-containing protein n=1 Tax=Megasphaera stantonii TaxID=2144175 RepID=UPI002F2682F1
VDMLKEVVTYVRLVTNLRTGQGAPKAPGMKYRHYAPSAPMTVVVGTEAAVTAKLKDLYEDALADGKTVGFLVSQEVGAHFLKDDMYIWGR